MCSSSSVLTVSLCLQLCLLLCLRLCLRLCLASGDHQEIIVKPGEDVTLPCHSSGEVEILLIQWIRPDLTSDRYVFLYKDGQFHPDSQLPSYCDRVELKDPELKNGDGSVILKNVTTNDTGTYECVVGIKGSEPELISSIDLTVQDSVPVNVTVKPGQSVSLPCRAPSNTEITVVEWTRAGLGPEYVLMYRDNEPVPHDQLPSYQSRVELKDREMKDGDVTMILKNVNKDDSGTYECRVFQRETNRRERSANTEPISIVHLEVHQSGHTEEGGGKALHVGLGVVLPAALLVVVVVAFIVRFLKEPETPPDKGDVGKRLPESLNQRRGQKTIL